MAVKNSIAKKDEKTKATEYMANGEKVKLSGATVRRYLVSGGGSVTDEEVGMFLSLCRFQHLNPFLREAYLIKYGSSPATTVVGKDVHLKRARRNPSFRGIEAGIIVRDRETGALENRQGTFVDRDNEDLVGGWASVYVDGSKPFFESVGLDEYIARKSDGTPNAQWSARPGTMIRKVALVHALREAFPEDVAGLYVPEEIPEVSGADLSEAPILVDEEISQTTPTAIPPEESTAWDDAL